MCCYSGSRVADMCIHAVDAPQKPTSLVNQLVNSSWLVNQLVKQNLLVNWLVFWLVNALRITSLLFA